MDTIQGTVTQHTYRTARVVGAFLRLPRDLVRDLEEQLSELSGNRVDNHTVYEIKQDDRPAVYVEFSDFDAAFGSTIEIRRR